MKTNLEILDERYCSLAKLPDGPPPTKKIAIISTPRTGSTLFCDRLTQTNACGFASEWFNPLYLESYSREFQVSDLDLEDYKQFIFRKTTTENGVFSVNFHVRQYIHWRDKGFDILDLNFDHVFRVYRKNRMAQAFSLLKARSTGQWSAEVKAKRSFSPSEIRDSEILDVLGEISRWDEYYRDNLKCRTDREYAYEDFRECEMLARDVLEECGISYSAAMNRPSRLQPQANSEDKERLALFREYLG